MLQVHFLPEKQARAFLERAGEIGHVKVMRWRNFTGWG